MQSNEQKIMYDIKNDCVVFDDDDDFQTLLKFQHEVSLLHANLFVITNFDFD